MFGYAFSFFILAFYSYIGRDFMKQVTVASCRRAFNLMLVVLGYYLRNILCYSYSVVNSFQAYNYTNSTVKLKSLDGREFIRVMFG
jgi:hypothetical protein